jgi:two-component system, LytTR family, response regulator
MNAIIIDDERKLAESLEIMLSKINEDITCIGIANNVMDGIRLINTLKPQVVFLDINMPQHSGFDLLDTVGYTAFITVFVTAHEEYAIQAIKHKAFDYLLKPVDMAELKVCVQKIKKELHSGKENKATIANKPLQIQIPVKEGTLLIKQEDIVHVEANGSYSIIHMNDKQTHLVTKNLKAMEELLHPSIFFRCHNSHIIHLHKIKKVLKTDGCFLELEDGSVIEVSRSKKDELLGRL